MGRDTMFLLSGAGLLAIALCLPKPARALSDIEKAQTVGGAETYSCDRCGEPTVCNASICGGVGWACLANMAPQQDACNQGGSGYTGSCEQCPSERQCFYGRYCTCYAKGDNTWGCDPTGEFKWISWTFPHYPCSS
jgi:hypothetical protein